MKKETFITASYLLVSVGLFVLAIEMWICGAEPHCRQSNSLVSNIARATVNITVNDYGGTGWSGPDAESTRFQVDLSGSQVQTFAPADGDGDGDGH